MIFVVLIMLIDSIHYTCMVFLRFVFYRKTLSETALRREGMLISSYGSIARRFCFTTGPLVLVVMSLISCGGGGGGGGPTNIPSGSTDSASIGLSVEGRAIIASDEFSVALIEPESLNSNVFASSISSLSKFLVQPVNAAVDYNDMSIADVLCYRSYPLDTLPADLDLDGDNFPDVNFLHSSGVVYRDIASSTFGLTQDEALALDVVEPDIFLLDTFASLDMNINSDIVTLNIPSIEGFALFNIDSDMDGQPDINIIADPSDQPSSIELVNFDGDYDGFPDLNIDRDKDGIAETNIDENGDCIADYSITDVDGAVGASFAEVELLDQSSWDVVASVTADPEGNFRLEGVTTGSYYIKIVANAGAKNVGALESVYITGDAQIGEYRLHSAPVIIEYETPLGSGNLVGRSELRQTGSMDLTLMESLDFRIRVYDFNQSPVSYALDRQVESGNWEKEYFALNPTDEPNISELVLSYSLSAVGQNFCASSLTNTKARAIRMLDEYDPTFDFCRLDRSSPEYWESGQPSMASEVGVFRDMYCLGNDDDVANFRFTGDAEGDGHCDLTFYFLIQNSGWMPPPGSEQANLEMASVEINDQLFDRSSGTWAVDGYYSPEVFPDEISVSINLDTDIPAENVVKQLFFATTNNCIEDQEVLGSEPFVPMDVSCLENYPQHEYRLRLAICERRLPDQPENLDCSSNSEGGKVTIVPPRTERIPIILDLLSNGSSVYEKILHPGETVYFEPEIEEPNSLAYEWRICFIGSECSDWLTEGERYSRVMTSQDANSQFRADISVRNNDGVATEWGYEESDGTYFEAIDARRRFYLNVSEI